VKHESLEQTEDTGWARTNKKDTYMWKRTGKRFSLTQKQGHDGHIREVQQEDSRSSMYKVYNCMIMLRGSS
jgi:hypothetical protein